MDKVSEITVWGVPKPQGSKSAFRRGNRIVMVEASKGLPEWRLAVIDAVKQEMFRQMNPVPITEPVSISVVFVLPKPQKPKFWLPAVKPDLDKLLRGLLDPLVIAGFLKDDSLVVEIFARKVYVGEAIGLPEPGARLTVTKVTEL